MSLFNLNNEEILQHNKEYMRNQLVEPNDPDYLYRAYPSSEGDHFYIEPFLIQRRTPCGAWISPGGRLKFVNFSHRKQFAYRTRLEAVQSLYLRMQAWEKRLVKDLDRALTMQGVLRNLFAKT
jgi:hypothetical protein